MIVPLSACGSNDRDVARQCGVSLADLERTKAAVSTMQPYAGAELGKCSVIKDDSGVEVIPPEAKRNADLMVEHERVLNAIADRCGTPRDVWRVVSYDQVQLVPPDGDASADKTDCLLKEFQKARLPVKLGFIGREHYEENKQ
jgi:hypothetical protein